MTTKTNQRFFYTRLTADHKDWQNPYRAPVTTLQGPFTWEDTINGVSVPAYRKKIAHGESATSPRSGHKSRHEASVPKVATCSYHIGSKANWVQHRDVDNSTDYTAYLVCGTIAAPSTDKALDHAKMSFIKKANEYLTTFHGAEFLGELKETIEGIFHPAKALRDGLGDYLRHVRTFGARRKDIKYLNQAVAGSWLEYSFGWAPLIGDIKDAAHAYERLSSRDMGGRIIVGTGFDNVDGQITGPATITLDHSYYDRYVIKDSKAKAEIIGLAKASSHGWATPEARLFGFTLDRFVPTVWELIPYSWLIDYFTNISDIINAAVFVQSDLRWTSQTTVTTRKCVVVDKFNPTKSKTMFSGATLDDIDGADGYSVFTRKDLVRSQPSSLVPGLSFRVPRYFSQFLNIGAIVLQAQSASKVLHGR